MQNTAWKNSRDFHYIVELPRRRYTCSLILAEMHTHLLFYGQHFLVIYSVVLITKNDFATCECITMSREATNVASI